MCGIIGILSSNPVSERIIDGLSRLEYRGYDSAGIATIQGKAIYKKRSEGKLQSLKDLLKENPIQGTIGIGHTRWATHGSPTRRNAHPHATDRVAVVHNGIIENYQLLKDDLIKQGVIFRSETDTEVVVHLIDQALQAGKAPEIAVQETLAKLHGAFALAIIFSDSPDILIGARRGSPLVLGIGNDELFLGSDAWALAPWTQEVCYLEEGDVVVMKRNNFSYSIFNESADQVTRPIKHLNLATGAATKGGYSHFMLKEIFEQSQTLSDTFLSLIDEELFEARIDLPIDFSNPRTRIMLIACGSSYYASLTAKYWFEKYAKISCEVDLASEFRYRNSVLGKDDICIFVSQSGETSDTLAALNLAKSKACKTLAIVNVPESSMVRAADHHVLTLAGPEIGVASTKAFTAQLAVLCVLALKVAEQRKSIDTKDTSNYFRELLHVPKLVTQVLQDVSLFDKWGLRLSQTRDILFIGRGTNYPIALEGALKLKEISYIHAEAYAAGELKHGPIALVDKMTPLIALVPNDDWFEKTVSNIQEVASRGAPIMVLTDDPVLKVNSTEFHKILLPSTTSMGACFIYTVAVQCIAYYTALHKGTDVDQPRNLAKSVTVE
ncbi:MAG: glutamine--fructose-6-phosphate transaminase (isomerizing) [Proteobacteria bacterium]|nr:glutamine--fructose-6-phosphate transaminase (isomerizing) [Pseudomonadota bacterium]